jgi:hypothetical protein
MTEDLAVMIAFAEARLAEEKAMAQALDGETWFVQRNSQEDPLDLSVCFSPRPLLIEGRADVWGDDMGEHIARHDPARVLRDVEAKRAILADHAPYNCGEPPVQRCTRCASNDAYPSGVAIMEVFPCNTVRLLVATWSDHPEYQEGWKP